MTAARAQITVQVPRAVMLSSNHRHNWREVNRRKAMIRDLGLLAGRNGPVLTGRQHCIVYVSHQDRRRRDVANMMASVKHLIDGMVLAGVLGDDSDRYLQGPDLRPSEHICPRGLVVFAFTFEPVP